MQSEARDEATEGVLSRVSATDSSSQVSLLCRSLVALEIFDNDL